MSVNTRFSEKIRQAKDELEKSRKSLIEAIHPDTHGVEDTSSWYMNDIMDSIKKLNDILNKL